MIKFDSLIGADKNEGRLARVVRTTRQIVFYLFLLPIPFLPPLPLSFLWSKQNLIAIFIHLSSPQLLSLSLSLFSQGKPWFLGSPMLSLRKATEQGSSHSLIELLESVDQLWPPLLFLYLILYKQPFSHTSSIDSHCFHVSTISFFHTLPQSLFKSWSLHGGNSM